MIKHILLCLLCSITAGYAQKTIPWAPKAPNPVSFPLDEQGEIRFREVVPLEKVSSATVLKRARTWAAKTYPSANEVVQQYDTAQGVMVIRGTAKLSPSTSLLAHRLVVEAKDGRYRVTVDQLAYAYELTTPIKLKREVLLHPYGVTADDLYDWYGVLMSQNPSQSMGLTSVRKMVLKAADQQEPGLVEIKQKIDALLSDLKKAVQEGGDW